VERKMAASATFSVHSAIPENES